jgi:hypothetical protein
MIFLSKGITEGRCSGSTLSVAHCGTIHRLKDLQAELWLSGRNKPVMAEDTGHERAIIKMAMHGIVEYSNEVGAYAVFRVLTNCVVCPGRLSLNFTFLSKNERRIFKWVKYAGLRLTIAELVFLEQHGVKPEPSILGAHNRQALTELIYTTETISDTLLEVQMEKSYAMAETVKGVLGLLHKKKVYLI